MALADKAGITTVASFKLQAEKHLDLRQEVATIDDLDDLYKSHAAPPGLTTWVDSEKCAYTHVGDGKWVKNITAANEYTHPTGAGNNHIPAGGKVGQILKNTGDGTAEWGDDENVYTSGNGVEIKDDKTINATNIKMVDKDGKVTTDNTLSVKFTD